MNVKTLRENARAARHIIQTDFEDYREGKRNPPAVQLDERQSKALADIQRDGFAVVPNFWDRERALAMRDKLEPFLEPGENQDFPEGAWLRFWDDRAYDQGVRRLYHVDKVVPELRELRFDPFV